MYTIAASRIVRFAVFALISVSALFLAATAYARIKDPGCRTWMEYAVECASNGDGCYRPRIMRMCGSIGPAELVWSSPWCIDDQDPDVDSLMDLMCTDTQDDGGHGIEPGTKFPFDFTLEPDSFTEYPCSAYPDIAEYDFPDDGQGAIYATRHLNGCGIIGEDTVFVNPDAYVGPDALIYGNAVIDEGVQILGNARVFGNAVIRKGSVVKDNAVVKGNAVVMYGSAVRENAVVDGYARLECGAVVDGYALVKDHGHVEGYDLYKGNRVAGETCGEYAMSATPGNVTGTGQLADCALIEEGEVVSQGTYSESCP
ncbi:MAG: hypothetical protein WC866_03810 [Patescibacteria group bacterium]|jgi:hypothetical protein